MSHRRLIIKWCTLAGTVLLPLLILSFWERKTLLPGEPAWAALPLLPTAAGVPIGAFVGCVLGFCLWIAMTRRPVHPLYSAVAFCFLSVTASLPLYGLYWAAETPDRPSGGGLGSTMQAIGLFWQYVLIVLPTCAIGGIILGTVVGVVRRQKAQSDR